VDLTFPLLATIHAFRSWQAPITAFTQGDRCVASSQWSLPSHTSHG